MLRSKFGQIAVGPATPVRAGDGTWLARVGIAQHYGMPLPCSRVLSFDNPFMSEDTALAHARERGLRIARDPVAFLQMGA